MPAPQFSPQQGAGGQGRFARRVAAQRGEAQQAGAQQAPDGRQASNSGSEAALETGTIAGEAVAAKAKAETRARTETKLKDDPQAKPANTSQKAKARKAESKEAKGQAPEADPQAKEEAKKPRKKSGFKLPWFGQRKEKANREEAPLSEAVQGSGPRSNQSADASKAQEPDVEGMPGADAAKPMPERDAEAATASTAPNRATANQAPIAAEVKAQETEKVQTAHVEGEQAEGGADKGLAAKEPKADKAAAGEGRSKASAPPPPLPGGKVLLPKVAPTEAAPTEAATKPEPPKATAAATQSLPQGDKPHPTQKPAATPSSKSGPAPVPKPDPALAYSALAASGPASSAPASSAPAPSDPTAAPAQRLIIDAPRRASAKPARPARRSNLPPLPALDRKFPGLVALNLQKSFGKRKVLHDVNIGIRPGEVVGLLGPNGAGKTTSFYIVCGLIQADKGYVGINQRNVSTLPMYRRAKFGLGYLPQEASIFRGLTVEQNIMAALEVVQPDRKKRKARLEELLSEFSITHLRTVNALALSGGERRRTEIARSLASNPQYILLDEPFAGVDPIAVGDIRSLVGQLKQRGIGVLITDHNVRDTLNVVDRAYIIYDGRVLMQGEPSEIVQDERVRQVYLGSDFEL